jgi:hypothetical protein
MTVMKSLLNMAEYKYLGKPAKNKKYKDEEIKSIFSANVSFPSV